MRSWIIAVLVVAPAGSVVGQPPASPAPKDPPPIVIKPRKPGESPAPGPKSSPAPAPAEEDPPGKIIIRPRKPGAAVPPAQGANAPRSGDQRTDAPAQGADAPGSPGPKNPGVNTPGSPALGVHPPGSPEPAPAAPKPAGTPLFDDWYAAAVDGQQIGYLQWAGREIAKNGRTLRVGVKTLRFTVDRFGERVTMFAEEATSETPAGEVVLTSSRQQIGLDGSNRAQFLALTGEVSGRTLKVRGEGLAAPATDTPWPEHVVGLAAEPGLFKTRAVKVGESFTYRSFAPSLTVVATYTVTRGADEAMVLWPGQPPKALHKYVAKMAPIDGIKLPPATTWTDAETGEPLLVRFDFPALGGKVSFLKTTEAAAKRPVVRPPDLAKVQSITLDRAIPGVHDRAGVVYKVSIRGDDEDDPGTVFASDARQRVVNLDPRTKTFELHVAAARGPVAGEDEEPAPGPEYLGSSYFIDAADPGVKAHAAAAVAGLPAGASAWDKAKAVEGWVKRNMRAVEFSQAMATADNVAKTLAGDCTEYAVLAAAMGRAVGVPTRTALGLVYAPGPGGRPILAYHMWFEAYADGRWRPLDPTLGLGGVGPGHLKITDQSWHNEKTLAPIFTVVRALSAKPAVSVGKVSP